MRRWEKRLSDLVLLLRQCAENYFDPELFRMNCNQFLTTARTVSFLIRKEKASIPDFDRWYGENVIDRWSGDSVMVWAKDSRNHIEKEGDLESYSELSVTLIYSYDERSDILIHCGRPELVGATVRHLLRRAEKHLPTGVADAAVLRLRRRWVANSLPDMELLHAFAYVYSQHRAVSRKLADHLGNGFPSTIPEIDEVEEFRVQQEERVRYVKFSDRRLARMSLNKVRRDPDFEAPEWLKSVAADEKVIKTGADLKSLMEFHARMAEGTFHQFGSHHPMLWMYDEAGEVIYYGGVVLDDQATKFIYWRDVAERVRYLRPSSVIWVCEFWIRALDHKSNVPIRKRPIKGEGLQLVGLDRNGEVEQVVWDILRSSSERHPQLLRQETSAAHPRALDFLLPVKRAFAAHR